MSPSADTRRPENLALLFQDVLTAVVRLRSNRQGVIDATAFRHQIREALKSAATRALSAGYTADDARHATFAAVAFLDESVLNSGNPIFAEWLRKPLQAELFGTHTAGEEFFVSLQQLLGRADAADLADLIEIHYLCLLLGFGGRYSVGNRGELAQIMNLTGEKIRRIRGRFGALSPSWQPSNEQAVSQSDPWVKRWGVVAAVCALVTVLLFAGYMFGLSSVVSQLRTLSTQGKG
jgi:type VI secretion system protein ImpK